MMTLRRWTGARLMKHLGYGEMMMRKTNWVALLMSLIIGAFLAGSAAKAAATDPNTAAGLRGAHQ